jgi:hypothetical protein
MMPVLIVRTRSWSSVASFCSTIADLAFGIAQHAAVAGRVIDLGDQHRQAARLRQQVAQGLRADQRHVAVQHQHLRGVRHLRHRLRHRVAGAQLLCLLGPLQVGLVGEVLPHRLTAMAIDHVDRRGCSSRAASITCASIGWPAIGCSTFGSTDFMRLPAPAARMMTCRVGSWERQSVVRCR